MTAHETLGVDPNASPEDIKKAYRRKSKAAHPDVGGDPAEFHALQKAYKEAMGEETTPRNGAACAARMYDEVVNQTGEAVYYVDIEAEMLARCRRDIDQIAAAHHEHNIKIRKYERINKRCGPDSIIKGMNDGMISEFRKSQHRMKEAIAELEEAMDFITGAVKFEPEEKPTPAPSSMWRTGFQFNVNGI